MKFSTAVRHKKWRCPASSTGRGTCERFDVSAALTSSVAPDDEPWLRSDVPMSPGTRPCSTAIAPACATLALLQGAVPEYRFLIACRLCD